MIEKRKKDFSVTSVTSRYTCVLFR